ncbi:hypothetical protein QJS10_CPB17g02195 [Acorus calamus]|uniref:CRAL-TRIO domain-containing protein n=1 Tax=Acorus calamus TaxID=4465 RepID=A0AAV9CSV6_ACOCL|nr:hypothetical protein QJS10_CPB17g02195 [Acorus calamus]
MFRRKNNSNDHREHDQMHPEEKVNELRVAIGPQSGRNLQFCTDACLRRYLEARNWNVDKSKKMLQETLKWRSTYKPEEIRWHEVAHEGETGKLYRASFQDRGGRPVLVLRPGKQNTSSHDNQLRHLVYLLENAILNLPDEQEQMYPTGLLERLYILQNHYPERLSAAFLYSPPRIFETFWKIIKYFLDPKTFQKVKFVYPKNAESMELMQQHFDIDILPTELGGRDNSPYDHEEFSRLMVKDDIKSAKLWGFDNTHSPNVHSTAVAPEPEPAAPPAS